MHAKQSDGVSFHPILIPRLCQEFVAHPQHKIDDWFPEPSHRGQRSTNAEDHGWDSSVNTDGWVEDPDVDDGAVEVRTEAGYDTPDEDDMSSTSDKLTLVQRPLFVLHTVDKHKTSDADNNEDVTEVQRKKEACETLNEPRQAHLW